MSGAARPRRSTDLIDINAGTAYICCCCYSFSAGARTVTTIKDLVKGVSARVKAIRDNTEFAEKLREFGFSEGDEVELLAHGPLGGQPLAVRLNRTVVAMRNAEAEAVEVEL